MGIHLLGHLTRADVEDLQFPTFGPDYGVPIPGSEQWTEGVAARHSAHTHLTCTIPDLKWKKKVWKTEFIIIFLLILQKFWKNLPRYHKHVGTYSLIYLFFSSRPIVTLKFINLYR